MDVEVVTNSIKQLVIGSGKFMQEANTFEQAEERIVHLEENDDQFHKYDLVKFLKSEIEECVGPIVDEEIERYTESAHENLSDTDTLVARITDKVTNSKQFAALKDDIGGVVHESVVGLVENFEEEFKSVTKDESPPPTPKQRDPCQFSDEESTMSGSYNHNAFMFVSIDQVLKYIQHLDKKNNLQTRQTALKDLLHMTMNEVQINDESYQREWASLERGLIDALSEHEDPILPKKAMEFISRGLATGQGNSRELYCALCCFLKEHFTGKRSVTKVKNGLDATRPETSNVLVSFRLMNDFQKHIPNYWVRYPTRFMYSVLETTVSLLSVGGHSAAVGITPSQNITPIHYLALLDPMAEWFKRWTHGCYSRLPLFDIMKKQKSFLENLIRSILEFVASRSVAYDLVSEASESIASHRGTIGSRQQRFTYTGDELEYIYFVHAMNIVGRILTYKQGTKLFPVKVKGYDDEITITKLICGISQLVTNPAGHGPSQRNITAVYEPSILAAEILKKLCASESTYQVCLCRDEVTATLLLPVARWIDNAAPDGSQASDGAMLNVADVLSTMASRSAGRRHLLYGERGDTFSRSSNESVCMTIETSSAAHTLAEFCKKALSNSLPATHGQAAKCVSGSYLFLCRQLYNNGEGLQAIYSYDLHNIISEAWREANKALNSLSVERSRSRKDDNRIWWEELLKDNLLSYATTPKGMLLMQQSSAMQACVEYMCRRHNQRIQVSSLEKFGYGSIITQIAGTACGMLELEKQGLISVLCLDAWNSIEPGEEFEIPFQPKIWSVDAIDKAAHKPLVNLLHVFSNFTSVFELVGGEKLPTSEFSFRDKPSTLIDLLNRVAIINAAKDDDKIHFLFNYEQSHVFGLRLLNALISCLDTQLLLDSQFKVIDTLIASQTAEDISAGGTVILDALAIERNHILARALVTGGPTERVLPPQALPTNRSSSLKFPLIVSQNIAKEYLPNIAGKSSMKQETELSKLLSESKSTRPDASWVEKCRGVFIRIMSTKPDTAKGNLLQELFEKTVSAMADIPKEAIFSGPASDSESGFKSFKLTTLQEYGVRKAVQYGVHLKLLTSTQESQDNLSKLLRHAGFYLKQQQRQVGSHLRSLNHNYVGFDWFSATVFLLMRGNYERSWKLLQAFSTLSTSAYLWGPRMHRSIHLPAHLASSSIPPVLFSACHNIELLLQIELPLVYPAFRMSGYTASQICQSWIRQCFWNFLDWTEICHYIQLCTLLGVDYQVYMCVAIFKHLQHDILHHQQQQDLVIYLRENPITGFKVGKNLDYMKQLEVKYRKTVLSDMLNLTKP